MLLQAIETLTQNLRLLERERNAQQRQIETLQGNYFSLLRYDAIHTHIIKKPEKTQRTISSY